MCAVFGFNDKFDMLLEYYYFINNLNFGTASCVCVCIEFGRINTACIQFDILLNSVDPFSVTL